jgi:hypothetical protein
VGFEPTLPFRVNTLSKRAPSATRPSLRKLKDLQQVPSNQVAACAISLNGGLCCPVSKHDLAVYQGTTVSSQRQPSNRALVYARIARRIERRSLPHARERSEGDRSKRSHSRHQRLPSLKQQAHKKVWGRLHASESGESQRIVHRPADVHCRSSQAAGDVET